MFAQMQYMPIIFKNVARKNINSVVVSSNVDVAWLFCLLNKIILNIEIFVNNVFSINLFNLKHKTIEIICFFSKKSLNFLKKSSRIWASSDHSFKLKLIECELLFYRNWMKTICLHFDESYVWMETKLGNNLNWDRALRSCYVVWNNRQQDRC